MSHILKAGDKLRHEGKEWIISEVGEDNEGQVVYHLKSGNDLSVVKESSLPDDVNVAQKQRSHHAGPGK